VGYRRSDCVYIGYCFSIIPAEEKAELIKLASVQAGHRLTIERRTHRILVLSVLLNLYALYSMALDKQDAHIYLFVVYFTHFSVNKTA
jgi:hypothetical protein